jgi:hypothetical protein
MRFSEVFSIADAKKQEWFDADLTVDTKLFVDPFLMLRAGAQRQRAHADLVAHFARCYILVAKAPNKQSLSAKQAHQLLTFPEPHEFCLGYTTASTKGSGGGSGRAAAIADGIAIRDPVPEALEDLDGLVDETLLVSDNDVIHAMQMVYTRVGLVTEPAGAAGLAGLWKIAEQWRGARVATILCGSNVTPADAQRWLSGL